VSDLKRLWYLFDLWVLRILQFSLAFGILAAMVMLLQLLIGGVVHAAEEIDSIAELQQAVQSLFAGVLLVVLGLELMDTLRNYFIEHRLRVELLISVALIAVARYVIQLDFQHTTPGLVAAMGFLIFALAASYVGVRAFVRDRPPSTARQ
jgi:uncharacterized membrane protein (DUF373 family)